MLGEGKGRPRALRSEKMRKVTSSAPRVGIPAVLSMMDLAVLARAIVVARPLALRPTVPSSHNTTFCERGISALCLHTSRRNALGPPPSERAP
eukprot:6210950-Pleurochrysis_carterae.AAC.1